MKNYLTNGGVKGGVTNQRFLLKVAITALASSSISLLLARNVAILLAISA